MKRHIIFSLLDSPAFGGAEQYLFSHLHFLRSRGYEIVLATNNTVVKKELLGRLTSSEKKSFQIVNAPYRLDAIGNWKGLIKFFLSLPWALAWCFTTLKMLRKKGDVICLWVGFTDRLVFSPIAKVLRCKLIWIEMGPLSPVFKRNFGFPNLLYKATKKFPTCMITISRENQTDIAKRANIPIRSIFLVYPGTAHIPAKQLKSYATKANRWKEKEKLKDKSLITVIGRLAHENEIENVIKAYSIYLHHNPETNTCLLVVGTGPQKKELVKLADKLKLNKSIRFTGFVSEEEKLVILSASHFFIFPRAWEWDGFGITTIEAMTMGLPVLTTRFGPQKEILTNGLEGFFYKRGDINSLAWNIKKLLSLSSQSYTEMRSNSLKRSRFFSEEKSQQGMLKIIKSLN